jgi:hypothetical protein
MAEISMLQRGMTTTHAAFAAVSDETLIQQVKHLAEHERHATAELIASLAELDARRLYLGRGCSSLFTYCTQVLRLSEHAAYRRIEAARAVRRFPIVLELFAAGAINLTTLGLLIAHLTEANHRALLNAATHKSKREVEHLIAALRPEPPAPTIVRKLPTPKPSAGSDALSVVSKDTLNLSEVPVPVPPRRPTVLAPLSPDLYKLQFTVTRGTYDKLQRAQDLLRHTIPSGDPATIFDRALSVLLASIEREKLSATTRPRSAQARLENSRHIPASVRRSVWARDAGRCAFVGATGRCTERGFLEFHHVVPFAAGGRATVENMELRCRAHNAYESEQFFGPLIARERPEYWTS